MRSRSQSGSIAAVIVVLVLAVVIGAAIPLLSGGRDVAYNARSWTPPPTRLESRTPVRIRATVTSAQVTGSVAQATRSSGPVLASAPAVTVMAPSPTATVSPTPVPSVTVAVTFSPVPTSTTSGESLSSTASPTTPAPTSSALGEALSPTAPPTSPTTPVPVSTTSVAPAPVGETPTVGTVSSPVPVTPVAALSPSPTPRPRPTNTPGVPVVVSPPALVSPDDGAVGRGVIRFEWLPTGPLPAGAGYEVVWWNPDERPEMARGLAPPVQGNTLELNIDALFLSNQVPSGRMFWTVLIVRLQPYARLTQPAQSPQHRFIYAAEVPPAPPPPPRP